MPGRMPPARGRRVFVDSSAYLAILDRDDEHYAEAIATLHALSDQRYRQFTTNILIIEAHALILSTLGIGVGQSFLQAMEESSTTIVRVRATDEERARRIVYAYTDKDFSLADATSFAVMERLGITLAYTYDRHFAQYGLSAVSAEML